MLVYLIRHPQPIEAQGLCYGRKDLAVDRAAETVLAVTHAGLIRVALACAGELSGPAFAGLPIPFGSIHRIVLEERGAAAALRA
jgi:broad specificity phosphatase PhoE